MKYRFTAEDFILNPSTLSLQAIADRANALLEQWEKESETLYGTEVGTEEIKWSHDHWVNLHSNENPKPRCDTDKAILWRPEKIGEKK